MRIVVVVVGRDSLLLGERSTFGRGKVVSSSSSSGEGGGAREKERVRGREIKGSAPVCVANERRKGKTRRNEEIKALFVGRSTTASASWALGNLRERSCRVASRISVLLAQYLPCTLRGSLAKRRRRRRRRKRRRREVARVVSSPRRTCLVMLSVAHNVSAIHSECRCTKERSG